MNNDFAKNESDDIEDIEDIAADIEKSFHIFNIAVFTGLLLIIGLVLFILPRSETSETERRSLEKFPKFSGTDLFSGEYTRKLGIYFSDTVPFREQITSFSSNIKNIMGIQFDSVRLHNVVITNHNDNTVSENDTRVTEIITPENLTTDIIIENINKNEIPSNESTNQEFIPVSDNLNNHDENEIADIRNNGILVYKTRGLMLYGGSREQGERYAAALNAYREILTDLNIYSMIVPTSVEFYCPAAYRNLSGNQREDINHITSLLDTRINPVNAYSAVSEHLKEDVYLRTDHHWAPLGAYYAATEFCKTAGVEFPDISEYEKAVISGYVGTLYGYSGDAVLKNNPEDFVYYIPKNEYSTTYYNYDDPQTPIPSSLFVKQSVGMSYCIFMGGDSKITHIKTDTGNGRKLAVFKDSYGNALVPFLVNSFEEIYVIDIRYFPYSAADYLIQNGVTDVLFCNNIFAANTGSLIGCIENILFQ